MLDYASLNALAAVVREGSFDRAADRLGVTPSAVSQRVRSLEDRIGAILVSRGQPCRATAIGARLCAHLEQVRLMESDVVGDLPMALPGQGERRTIRIALNADSLNSWFAEAASRFAWENDVLLDLVLDDEAHTAKRLREGDVLAAVTADPAPVQGCSIRPLGIMRYVATASPAFMARHFADGVNAATLALAPVLRFDRRDELQHRWVRQVLGAELDAPSHWIPATQAFLDLSLLGLGWAMNPEMLAQPHVREGRLVPLVADRPLDVALYWQVTRIGTGLLQRLTDAVRAAASARLIAAPQSV